MEEVIDDDRTDPPLKTAAERMDDVVWFANRLSQARREGVNRATLFYFQRKYNEAVQRYTNPFKINKYVQ